MSTALVIIGAIATAVMVVGFVIWLSARMTVRKEAANGRFLGFAGSDSVGKFESPNCDSDGGSDGGGVD